MKADSFDRLGRALAGCYTLERELGRGGMATVWLALDRLVALKVLYARTGRLEEARRHWTIFSETFTNPDPEARHLVDEAREALMEAERGSR